ncbi:hypothetical protein B0T16DRAFT_77721 [Cercophora newfieldiana]|uniref:Uncharacterized protein n=1 Tax=Cercophora newfieldiana TaxID=92897 RepID=A0AA39YF23_9PEZI|nr:hypothetical protein B0T16DRAFT_77721 [Cercophora newfieldiana]
MSYQSGHPYSRRPDDERRPTDSAYDRLRDRDRDRERERDRDRERERDRDRERERDRDREPGYGRSFSGGSRHHDRERERTLGSPPRDRDAGYDGPRAPSRQSSTTSLARFDPVTGRATNAPSAPLSPMTQGDGAADFVTHCVSAIDLVAQLAAVKTRKDTLSKTLEQKKSEADRTKSKHGDTFPSVSEVREKDVHREDRRLKALENDEQKVRARLSEALQKMPSRAAGTGVLGERSKEIQTQTQAQTQLQTLQKAVDNKFSVVNKSLEEQMEASKGTADLLHEQLELLKKQIAEQKEHQQGFQQEVASLREQLTASQAEQTSKMQQDSIKQITGQGKEMKSQLDLFKKHQQELAAQFKKQQEDLMAQVAQSKKDQEAQLKKQQEDLMAQVAQSKKDQEAQLKKQQEDLMAQVAQSKKDQEAQLKKQQEELAAQSAQLKKEQQELADQVARLKKLQEPSTAQVKKQKDEPPKTGPKNSEIASSKDLAVIRKQNSELKSECAEALRRVEALEMLNEVRDRQEDGRKNDLKDLSEQVTTCLQKSKEHGDRVFRIEETFGNIDFQGLDVIAESYTMEFSQVKKNLTKVQEEVKRVDEYIDKGVLEPVGEWVDDLRKEIREVKAQQAGKGPSSTNNSPPVEDSSIKTEIASLKKEMDGFSAETKKSMGGIRNEIKEAVQFLNHQISSLEQRYNNISTKELGERMLGVLENVYPNAKNIEARIRLLHDNFEEQKRKLGELDEKTTENGHLLRKVAETNRQTEETSPQYEGPVRKRQRLYLSGVDVQTTNRAASNGVNGHRHT